MATGVKVRRIQKIEIDSPDLPTKLDEALKAAKKSVSKLCAEIKISRAYWYRLVGGKEDAIAEEMLRKIEQALGVNFGINFEGKNNGRD